MKYESIRKYSLFGGTQTEIIDRRLDSLKEGPWLNNSKSLNIEIEDIGELVLMLPRGWKTDLVTLKTSLRWPFMGKLISMIKGLLVVR